MGTLGLFDLEPAELALLFGSVAFVAAITFGLLI